MSNPPDVRHRLACAWALISAMLLADIGCTPVDTSLADGLSMTTASVDAVRAADVVPSSPRVASQTTLTVSPKSGSVVHAPVYFRSDAERPDENDTDFGIAGVDYAVWIFESAKFFTAIATYPLHAVLTPFWTRMESDGQHVPYVVPDHRSEHGSG